MVILCGINIFHSIDLSDQNSIDNKRNMLY